MDRVLAVQSSVSDLIDTLWNVKLKGFPIGKTKNGDLIDTLWNVKVLKLVFTPVDISDLIDTLWNVKPGKTAGIAGSSKL